jgi:hypothetical protein
VRAKLVETLYTQPTSLAAGAVAGIACTGTAIAVSDSLPVTVVGALLIGTAATPAPAYTAEVEARGGDALFRANTAPAAGQVRDEYARSGQWLRQP